MHRESNVASCENQQLREKRGSYTHLPLNFFPKKGQFTSNSGHTLYAKNKDSKLPKLLSLKDN